jgi:hypothetical protein
MTDVESKCGLSTYIFCSWCHWQGTQVFAYFLGGGVMLKKEGRREALASVQLDGRLVGSGKWQW